MIIITRDIQCFYNTLGHKLRLFNLREAQFVTEGIIKTLDVPGYNNQKVPNTFVVQSNPTGHLGIILPGYRHSAGMADLHHAGRILMERGVDCSGWNITTKPIN